MLTLQILFETSHISISLCKMQVFADSEVLTSFEGKNLIRLLRPYRQKIPPFFKSNFVHKMIMMIFYLSLPEGKEPLCRRKVDELAKLS